MPDDLNTWREQVFRCWQHLLTATDDLTRTNLIFMIRDLQEKIDRAMEATPHDQSK